MIGLEVAKERERDALRQRRWNEWEAVALAVAKDEIDERKKERMIEANWVANT
jgi:hypothetical protein